MQEKDIKQIALITTTFQGSASETILPLKSKEQKIQHIAPSVTAALCIFRL